MIPRDAIRALLASGVLSSPPEYPQLPTRAAANVDDDPAYEPYGNPADSYRVALQAKLDRDEDDQ